MSFTDAAFYGVVAAVATSVIYSVGTDPRSAVIYRAVAGLRPRHFVANLPAMIATMAAAVLLLQVPGLDWGWARLLGGSGNVMLGVREETATDPSWAALVPFAMIGLLLAALPVLVLREEEMFRLGSQRRSRRQRLAKAAVFGALHLTAGVPLAAALALTVAGLWFTNRYLVSYVAARRAAPATPFATGDCWGQVPWGEPSGSVPAPLSTRSLDDWEDAGLRGAFHAHLAWNLTVVLLVLATLVAAR